MNIQHDIADIKRMVADLADIVARSPYRAIHGDKVPNMTIPNVPRAKLFVWLLERGVQPNNLEKVYDLSFNNTITTDDLVEQNLLDLDDLKQALMEL